MEKLDQNLPVVQSLAGNRHDRINGLLREGEVQLAKGEYFAAERVYRHVLAVVPGHPMARIGLVHAQLGAGMIRSAAYTLRALFDQHPELIATHYNPSILPPVERIKWVRGELEKMIRTTNRQEPALLLAYLGYQMYQPDLVRYGLDLAEARQVDDPLITLLRGIWLEEHNPAKGQAGEQPGGDAKPGP